LRKKEVELIYGSIICTGTSTNPSILTAWNDDLFGGYIQPYTTCPTYSAAEALWDYFINTNLSISNMRFRWANTGIHFDNNGCYTHSVSSCSFEFCQLCIRQNGGNVQIADSTRCGVNATKTVSDDCGNSAGSLANSGIGDSNGNGWPDQVEYQFYGRLGSLPANIMGGINAQTYGHSPANGDELIWSNRDDANMVYQYNPNCWLYGVTGLSAFSPWHDPTYWPSSEGGPTLITPRHAISVDHVATYAFKEGTVIRFVGTDNVARKVTCLHGEKMTYSDTWVMVFDQDCRGAIKS
jgi:hypothetical protein